MNKAVATKTGSVTIPHLIIYSNFLIPQKMENQRSTKRKQIIEAEQELKRADQRRMELSRQLEERQQRKEAVR